MWRERECWIPKKMVMRVFKPALLLLVVAGILAVGSTRLELSDNPQSPTSTVEQMQRLAGLPLSFVENQGQWEMPAQFVARTRGMVAYLEKDAVTLQLEARETEDRVKGVAVRLAFEGASESATLAGEHPRAGVNNFFVGNDRSRWRTEVPGYARVVYRGLYDGVDLCVREESGALEYDVLLAEGADLSQVVIRCDGIEGFEIHPDGSLTMETELGPITQRPPKTWYELASGERQPVECLFREIDSQRYGFEVPERDMSLALVIDPWLEWSTYIGTPGDDDVLGVAVDASGAVTLTGNTNSPDFPTTAGAYDEIHNGNYDWYVARLSADGSTLLWCTYIGGADRDWPMGVGLDDAGRVTVAGLTFSSDFPTTPGSFQTTIGGTCDAAVVCLNSLGTDLIYSTYLGGTNYDWILGLAVNGPGDVFVGGYTTSGGFPATRGAYDESYNGLRDAFVTCLSRDGTILIYSTFLGGSGEEGVHDFTYAENLLYMGLALHDSGEVIVGGLTRSSDFPTTPGAYDETYNGVNDAFVTRLNATGSDLVYSTFLGGSNGECVQSVAVDGFGVATVGGYTWSSDFPTTPGAYDETFNSPGLNDAFVSRLNAAGSHLPYSTFIGGDHYENTLSLALDASGEVIGAGFTRSHDFPTTLAAYDDTFNGNSDAFVFRLSPDGAGEYDLLYSTFIGGPQWEYSSRMSLDPRPADHSSVILGGYCQDGFPVTPGAYDTTYNGSPASPDSVDGFVCRFSYFVAGVEETTVDRVPLVKLSSVSPNPTDGILGYSIDLPQATTVQVHVFDITGRKVQTLLDERLPAGVHGYSERLRAEEGELASGVYYLRLEANGAQETRKFTLVR